MIVLSGSSGSGKTSLCREYARVTGSICHVIPVKPNWTSAEDLLGFYSPIEKRYLKTPFLNALLEASKDPSHLHIICLDEMNLARPEYYFADFLSVLETRSSNPRRPECTAGCYSSECRYKYSPVRRLDKESAVRHFCRNKRRIVCRCLGAFPS